jgi:hypothetical protein
MNLSSARMSFSSARMNLSSARMSFPSAWMKQVYEDYFLSRMNIYM